jgi:hypothetical protein
VREYLITRYFFVERVKRDDNQVQVWKLK